MNRPLTWLRLEPDAEMAELSLTMWSGGNETLLAKSGYHGRPVTWLCMKSAERVRIVRTVERPD